MIHSIAHYFEHFGIKKGTVGLEYTFLTQSMMGMMTHPHAKPEQVAVKDCTHIMSEMHIVKDEEEIKRISASSKVADAGHEEHIFGPPIHGVGIEFEESPLPPGHAFFHGEKEPKPLEGNTVIAVGNCGLYLGNFGVRVEDTIVVKEKGNEILTGYPRQLEP